MRARRLPTCGVRGRRIQALAHTRVQDQAATSIVYRGEERVCSAMSKRTLTDASNAPWLSSGVFEWGTCTHAYWTERSAAHGLYALHKVQLHGPPTSPLDASPVDSPDSTTRAQPDSTTRSAKAKQLRYRSTTRADPQRKGAHPAACRRTQTSR